MERIDIVVLTCNRIAFLKQAIASFEERLKTPYRLIIVNNNSKDGTNEYLEELKSKANYPIDIIHNKDREERGMCDAFTQGLGLVKSEFFITTPDDMLIPKLEPDIITQLIDLLNKYPEAGAISLRIPEMKRHQVGDDELIWKIGACPAYFRIQRKSDMDRMGGFGHARRWEDSEMVRVITNLGKKCTIASNLYVKDIGTQGGYPEWYKKTVIGNYNRNFEWVAKGKRKMNRILPEIDPITYRPIV
jgi:glycosyltransferase involved in cell wall biosynthesis